MEKKNGGPAFPRPYSDDTFNDETCLAQSGMTLRDYFAAKAMQGFAASDSGWTDGVVGMARCSYEWADAMLAAREKGDEE